MSCGIKAYYEELDEKIAEDKRKAFEKHTPYQVRDAIEGALENLKRMHSDNALQLSKFNWARLDGAITRLSELLK